MLKDATTRPGWGAWTAARGPNSRLWKLFPGLIAAIFISGCDDWGGEQARQRLHLPPYGFEGDARSGRTLYVAHCSECHGDNGRGTAQGPPLVDRVYRPSHHPDEAFHLAVAKGVKRHHWNFGDMPPVSGLTPEEVAHIAAFVRLEQSREGVYQD